jgi:hypothetical protein
LGSKPFLNLKGGIKLMKLATEFHPDKAWLWRNMAWMQEETATSVARSKAVNECWNY